MIIDRKRDSNRFYKSRSSGVRMPKWLILVLTGLLVILGFMMIGKGETVEDFRFDEELILKSGEVTLNHEAINRYKVREREYFNQRFYLNQAGIHTLEAALNKMVELHSRNSQTSRSEAELPEDQSMESMLEPSAGSSLEEIGVAFCLNQPARKKKKLVEEIANLIIERQMDDLSRQLLVKMLCYLNVPQASHRVYALIQGGDRLVMEAVLKKFKVYVAHEFMTPPQYFNMLVQLTGCMDEKNARYFLYALNLFDGDLVLKAFLAHWFPDDDEASANMLSAIMGNLRNKMGRLLALNEDLLVQLKQRIGSSMRHQQIFYNIIEQYPQGKESLRDALLEDIRLETERWRRLTTLWRPDHALYHGARSSDPQLANRSWQMIQQMMAKIKHRGYLYSNFAGYLKVFGETRNGVGSKVEEIFLKGLETDLEGDLIRLPEGGLANMWKNHSGSSVQRINRLIADAWPKFERRPTRQFILDLFNYSGSPELKNHGHQWLEKRNLKLERIIQFKKSPE